jgi:serine/threonine-protein kinase HipA
MRKAKIYFQENLAGILQESENGYEFQYEESYLQSPHSTPIGINYPLQKEPFFTKTIPPFFDGLIPEGWLLNYAIQNWKLNPRDRFGLLLKTCRDCIGAVSVEEVVEK